MKLTAAFMLLITLLCTSVRATEELPVVYAVLPTDYTHIFRRPSFIIVNNRLILCWQRPSPGEKDELPVISAITGEKTQLKSRPPGLKPATIEYITLQLDDLTHQLPITTPQGRIELPEPAGLFPDYTLALSDNGKYLIGYSSDLRYTHLNSAKSVTLMELQYIEGQVVPSVSWTLPKRERILWSRKDIERYMKYMNCTEEQVLATHGSASDKEFTLEYNEPTIARDEKNHVSVCIGAIISGIQPDQGNIWISQSTDTGKTWTTQTPLGWGLKPTIAVRNGEMFVVATDRIREELFRDVNWGNWPDEYTARNSWPVVGRQMLWHWQFGQPYPKEPVVVINEPKAIQSYLTVRDDGLLILILTKSESMGSSTSLWITTSQDGLKWDTPSRLTDSKIIDRDVSAIWYQNALWIAFARGQARLPSSIYLMRYDKLPPVK